MSVGGYTLDFSIIRDLRKQAKMTLDEVSKQSGISIAGLSKLERNQTIIELDTLYRLSRVFALSATDLLNLIESASASTASGERYRSGPFDFDKIAFNGIDCFRAIAAAGSKLSKPEAHGDDFEICWVHTGEVIIRLPREQHTLSSGQALRFDAILHHTYEIVKASEITIIHTQKPHRM